MRKLRNRAVDHRVDLLWSDGTTGTCREGDDVTFVIQGGRR